MEGEGGPGADDELETFHDCVCIQSCIVILCARANLLRCLFEGGVYLTQRLQLCGVYLRAASI